MFYIIVLLLALITTVVVVEYHYRRVFSDLLERVLVIREVSIGTIIILLFYRVVVEDAAPFYIRILSYTLIGFINISVLIAMYLERRREE